MNFTYEREFTYTRAYRGPIRCIILDWAGTTMDFGCMAPAVVFQQVFEKAGVPISMEEARIPMGRLANTEDISRAVLFLASDLNSYITGQSLVVDGGYSIA